MGSQEKQLMIESFFEQTQTPMTTKRLLHFECPHCGGMCEVLEKDINCGIFRHAVHSDSFLPFNPHASEKSIQEAKVHGCGKPFRLDSAGRASKCEYI